MRVGCGYIIRDMVILMAAGKLTQKQENFCLAYIGTGNASEAYRTAYEAEGMTKVSVNRESKSVMDNPKIAARLAEFQNRFIHAYRKDTAFSFWIDARNHRNTGL